MAPPDLAAAYIDLKSLLRLVCFSDRVSHSLGLLRKYLAYCVAKDDLELRASCCYLASAGITGMVNLLVVRALALLH